MTIIKSAIAALTATTLLAGAAAAHPDPLRSGDAVG